MASPPTWNSTSLLESEKSGVKPPQGESPSLSSLKPMDAGYLSSKWASERPQRAAAERRVLERILEEWW